MASRSWRLICDSLWEKKGMLSAWFVIKTGLKARLNSMRLLCAVLSFTARLARVRFFRKLQAFEKPRPLLVCHQRLPWKPCFAKHIWVGDLGGFFINSLTLQLNQNHNGLRRMNRVVGDAFKKNSLPDIYRSSFHGRPLSPRSWK